MRVLLEPTWIDSAGPPPAAIVLDVRTGALLNGPSAADVPTYRVVVDGDTVYLKRSTDDGH